MDAVPAQRLGARQRRAFLPPLPRGAERVRPVVEADPERLFEHLHGSCPGLLETLVLTDTWGLSGAAQRARLFAGLSGPASPNSASHRRRWLVSVGLLAHAGCAHTLTPLGRQVLLAHTGEVAELRKRIEDLLEEERDADLAFADAMEDLLPEHESPAPAPAPAPVPVPPLRDRALDLTPALLAPHLAHLDLPEGLLPQIAAALSSGKHLLFAGPPGTGKTEIALGLGEAAASAGYCRGMLTATASADWTTFETIGGYALDRDGALRFRAGVFLTALEEERWLLVDELNRADTDRAFGELYTVLAGRGASTHFRREDGRAVTIGPDEGATYRVRPSFRIVATLNTWDRASLFRLSAALLRRFAVVHVGPPDQDAYARLLDREASAPGPDPCLDPRAQETLRRIFSRAGLLAHCPVGPAIAIDMVRYARRRAAGALGLAEAVSMVLLPQLEGLPGEAVEAVASVLDAELLAASALPSKAIEEVRSRLGEMRPRSPWGTR